MIETDLNGVRIAAVVSAVPKNVDDLSVYRGTFGEAAVKKFSAMTGVKERRIAREEQTSSDLAYAAAEHLLARERIHASEIGGCIFVTQTPDYRLPSTACVLQKRLGLSTDCIAFDVNLGCSGYVYGLNIAASLMKTNGIEKCLLLVGDTLSKVVSDEDRSACMLFGDAGAATLLTLDAGGGMAGGFKSDGNGFKTIIVPAGAYRNRQNERKGGAAVRSMWGDGNRRSDFDLYMNGTNVFNFTNLEVPALIREYMARRQKTVEDFDVFVMHQANRLVLKQLERKIEIAPDKLPVSMDRYGNASAASIPITLCDAFGNKSGPFRTLLCGFGVGLSWGVVDAVLDSAHVYPIIETDEFYREGGVSHG